MIQQSVQPACNRQFWSRLDAMTDKGRLFVIRLSRRLCKNETRRSISSSAVLGKGEPKAFINGVWTDSASGKSFPVTNPATGAPIASLPLCDEREARGAIESARNAFHNGWAFHTTAKERGTLLAKVASILIERQNALAEILTAEQGKPLAEAKGEILYSASFFDWYASEGRRMYGQVVPPPANDRLHLHTREPSGVAALITPWNFPMAMLARKAAAAFAAGCTVVAKPAEDTPLSALALASAAEEAGFPAGVFNVLTADRDSTARVGKTFCESDDVDVISFTGSTAVGKILLHQSADKVKRVCLELGGSAPLIVFPTADIEKAVAGTMASKFRGSGQTCVCANRIFVHSSIYDQYVESLKNAVSKLVVGDGSKPNVTQGPLINERAVEKVEALVADALKRGAKLICGGKGDAAGPAFYQPTLLAGITPDMDIACAEIFGPVAAIQRFESEDDVLRRANDSRMGLAGYFFSQNIAQIHRVYRRLEVGMVGINEGIISAAEAAFGGVKESGLGREGAAQGIDEFTNWKYVCWGGLGK